jgi:hypothetical protein
MSLLNKVAWFAGIVDGPSCRLPPGSKDHFNINLSVSIFDAPFIPISTVLFAHRDQPFFIFYHQVYRAARSDVTADHNHADLNYDGQSVKVGGVDIQFHR